MPVTPDQARREAAVKILARLEEHEAHVNYEEAQSRWHKWVRDSLEKGAGAAHRWTNAPNLKTAEVKAPGKNTPQEVIEAVRDDWAKEWRAEDQNRIERADEAIRSLRRRAKEDVLLEEYATMVTAESIKLSASSFKGATSIGSDGLSFQ